MDGLICGDDSEGTVHKGIVWVKGEQRGCDILRMELWADGSAPGEACLAGLGSLQ